MLKKFFSGVLSSFVGAWLALSVFSISSVIMSFALLGAMSSEMSTSSVGVQEKSILYLNLSGSYTERTNPDQALMALLNKDNGVQSSLETIKKALAVASENNNIEGVFIECNGNSAGMATQKEIRDAIKEFKKSGKWVIAYGGAGIGQGDYYLSSVADSIYLNPVGAVDVHGLQASIPFFKNVLDKVGVKMQVVRVGTFKSAVEPYVETEASAPNRLATETYLKSIWANISSEIAESRSISVEKLNAMADSLMLTNPAQYFVDNKMADGLCYRFDLIDNLKVKTGVSMGDDLRLVSPEDLAALYKSSNAMNKVAVVYAVGGIDDGSDDGIVSEKLVKDIIEIAKDDAVKALVLRVNSPGGSAYGSEQIWAALEEVKKAGKPFAVSMGDYAASGGYYISCGADRIFAEPMTLTGSIGIFGMIPCVEELVKDKIGVNFTNINTNGDPISLFKPMTPMQRASMQRMVNAGYELFTKRCADGRDMELADLKKIAEGRVWDGETALNLGLVDEMGGLESAISYVVEQAKLADYAISTYPEQESSFMRYFKGYVKTEVNEMIGIEVNGLAKYQSVAEDLMKRPYLQCVMEPIEIR